MNPLQGIPREAPLPAVLRGGGRRGQGAPAEGDGDGEGGHGPQPVRPGLHPGLGGVPGSGMLIVVWFRQG